MKNRIKQLNKLKEYFVYFVVRLLCTHHVNIVTDSNENMFIMNTRKRKLLSFVVTDNSIHLTENVRPSIRYFTIITQEIIQSNSNIIHQNFIVLVQWCTNLSIHFCLLQTSFINSTCIAGLNE